MDAGEAAGHRPLETRPHLNGASPGVEVGGPQTFGGRGVGGDTPIAATTAVAATAATTTATAAIAIVAIILVFAGLLQLLFLRAFLLLMLSWRAFLPVGRGRRRWRLLCSVEGSGVGG
jgi:hypothetical protein